MKNIKMLVASLTVGLVGVSALVLDHTMPGLMDYALDGNVRAVGVQDAVTARDDKNVQFPTPTALVSEDLPVMTGHPHAAVTKAPPGVFIKEQRDNAIVATFMTTFATTGPVTVVDHDSHLTVISGSYMVESEVVTTLTVATDSDTTVPVTATVTTDSLSTDSATAADDYSTTDSALSTTDSSSASETASSSSTQINSDVSVPLTATSTKSPTCSSSTSSATATTSGSAPSTSSFDSSASEASPTPSSDDPTPDPTSDPTDDSSSSSTPSPNPNPDITSAASNCTVLNALSTLALCYAAFYFWDMPFFDRI